jgi:chromosome condensin MukBEF ATPase and DNA-binding subunit MukB
MPDAPEPTTFAERRRAAVAEATERELHDLRARLAEAEQALAVTADLAEAELAIERLRALLAHRDAEAEPLRAELRAIADERNALRAERDHLRTVLEQMKSSASWRVTGPLRRLKR